MLMPLNPLAILVPISPRIKLDELQAKSPSLAKPVSFLDQLANLLAQSHLFVALKRVVNN
jgi:hypothetical protein